MEPSIWNDKVVTDLRALAELQLSASKIASQLAHKHGITVTRSAVIGKAFRNEIQLNGAAGQSRRRMSEEEANQRRRDHNLAERLRRQRKKAEREAGLAEIEAAPPIEDMAISIGQRRTLLQLRDCDCRWPVGQPGTEGFFFCGGTAIEGLSYCAYHWRVGHAKREPRTRQPYSRPANHVWGAREL